VCLTLRHDDWRARAGATLLRHHGVVAYPTEGVWGLGCMPGSTQALNRILALKGRAQAKGMILVAGDERFFAPLLEGLPVPALRLFRASAGEHITWLVPWRGRLLSSWCGRVCAPRKILSPIVRGASDHVAIRLSMHPVIAALTRSTGTPIISTSANPAGRAPARSAFDVRRYFRNSLDAIVPGSLGNAAGPSEIRDLLTGAVVRPAAVGQLSASVAGSAPP